MRELRFGLSITAATDHAAVVEAAQAAERDGFSTLLVADHYVSAMACGPVMLAAAAATTSLRVGSLVYDNDFRHPALLAKEAATIDVLSGGRLELGVGAGWHKPEYDSVGLPFDPPAVRAGRLEEAIEIITGLLAGDEVTFTGEHYEIAGLRGLPKAIQQPVPIFLGAGGPRLLRFAGRRAQIVGLAPRSLPEGGLDSDDLTADAMDQKVAWVTEGAEAAGRTEGGPERSILLQGVFATAEEAAARFGGAPVEVVAESPHLLIGSVDEIVETMLARVERWGITYYVCFDRDLEALAPVVRALAASG